MARSVNKVTILGNLGQEPELRSTPSGTSVCTLRIATSESYKDKNGEWQENTEWHRVVLWDRLADIASQYLRKGSKTYIEGKLQTRTYEKDGETRYITEIRGNSLILLDKKEQGGSGGAQDNSYTYEPVSQSENMGKHLPKEDNIDDEVPF